MKRFFPLISLAVFFICWTAIAWYFRHTPFIFPFPWKVIQRVILDLPLFFHHATATYLEMVLGMILATIFSAITAYMMLKAKLVKAILEPYFVVMQCLPMFTLAPLCIIWFGWSFVAIILPTALMISLPLTMSIYRGLTASSKQHLDFFRLHGASEKVLLFKLRIPFALPHIFAGLRVSAAVSGMGAIAGEWAGAQRGLGVFLQISKRNFDLESVFGSILVLLLLNLSIYAFVVILEKLSQKDRYATSHRNRYQYSHTM